jgi:hypothetical protein
LPGLGSPRHRTGRAGWIDGLAGCPRARGWRAGSHRTSASEHESLDGDDLTEDTEASGAGGRCWPANGTQPCFAPGPSPRRRCGMRSYAGSPAPNGGNARSPSRSPGTGAAPPAARCTPAPGP